MSILVEKLKESNKLIIVFYFEKLYNVCRIGEEVMNKKGFTLVELLAVIAILAILVIIALPNVLETYKEARKASFIAEARNIYKASQQQWLLDSMANDPEVFYARCDGCQSKELTLNGREEIEYFIQLDSSGKVLNFFVTDGIFQTSYIGLFGDTVAVTELDYAEEINELDDEEIFSILNVETKAYENYEENNGGQNLGCEPGHYLDISTNSCVPCPPNTYKDDYGNYGCTNCPANTCSSSGAALCKFCGGTIIPITPINPPVVDR